jgi:hypothetical protein
MNGIVLKRNPELYQLLTSAIQEGDPETAALAAALRNRTRPLDLASLGKLSERILAGDNAWLIYCLTAYCRSTSIILNPERLPRQPKGWRKLSAWAEQKFLGVKPKPVWIVIGFGEGEKEGDTIS